MRFGLSVAVLALVLVSGSTAHAQQNQQQTSYVYGGSATGTPVYNSNVGSAAAGTGTSSIYNSGAALQMLPMQRMTAGQNAPSYTYNNQRQGTQPYTNYNMGPMTLDPNAIGSLTADQARMIREQRNAQANAYQQQYLEQLRQRDMNNPYLNPTSQEQQQMQQQLAGASQYQGGQFAPLYANSGQQKPPVKRKVIYNELNNPLVEPPRLFNLQ